MAAVAALREVVCLREGRRRIRSRPLCGLASGAVRDANQLLVVSWRYTVYRINSTMFDTMWVAIY